MNYGSIPIMINEEMNEELTKKITKQEVKNLFFSMQKDQELGSNGFQVGFFQLNWDIIYNDVVEVVTKVLRGERF